MRHRQTLSLTAVLCLSVGAPAAAEAAGLKAAIFDIEPVDLPMGPAMRQKLDTYSKLLRQKLVEKGVTIVDPTPQAAKIAENLPLSQCNGCDQDIAKALGADIEVTTAVQSASSNVFTLSGSVKDVATNRVLRQGTVDIHGPSDDYWSHGVKFLVRERLTDPTLPADATALRKEVDALPKVN